uniref:Acetyl-coenzyme A carboxylase carboxyl transferase subunit beta n=1 Tax=Rhizanthella gardneri TaxID=112168 RepID=E7BKU9_RHIGD|nr:AccD [Rhizanthella gardneri]ACU46588.1 AccD [Rhizanthella gardneri]
MAKYWFNLMLSYKMLSYNKLEHRCGLSKSMDNLNDLGHIGGNEELILNENDAKKNILGLENYNTHSINYLFDSRNIYNLIYNETFLVRNSNGYHYFVYFDIENKILNINNVNYLNNVFNNNNHYSYYPMYDDSMYDTQSNWNNHIDGCIDAYLHFEISLNSDIYDGIKNYITDLICTESRKSISSSIESENYSIETSNSSLNRIEERSDDFDKYAKYRHLWVQCENCYVPNYKKFLKSKMNICEYCGYHLKMSSLDRIELLIDPGTWESMDEDMVYEEPIESIHSEEERYIHLEGGKSIHSVEEYIHLLTGYALSVKESISSGDKSLPSWEEYLHSVKESTHSEEEEGSIHLEEESYIDRIDFYQRTTGLIEAVQTGIGQLNSVPIAIGVMDFQFIGGSMGSVVGEKITRLIEYATNQLLPVILVCASGGARMQEGSLSLMQMAKISSVSYDYQSNKKLFYVSILASPTTGGVTASFGMLGDIIIAEPNAYIAFAGKRVIEQTLNKPVPDGSQEAEYLFHKGLFDPIVPRNLLKNVLNELFQLHGFLPLNKDSNSKK